MKHTAQIAKHIKEVHFGKNWTWSSLKENLEDITWKQATTQVFSFNTIAALVFHINYFEDAILKVLEGGTLDAKDEFSFDVPSINSKNDWDKLVDKTLKDAKKFTSLVEQLPESKLWETFSEEKYGNYFRNLHGVIEHTHYHLGQIVIIKKIIQQTDLN
jgi:uncharacterized damage-inducible protein DinB